MIKPTKHTLAVAELTLAGIIWGGSFTLVRWGLEDFSATTLIFWRFIIAFFIGEAISYFSDKTLFKTSHSDAKLALNAGLFLGLSLLLQTYGLNYTTATNSGFITSLYVVLIPIIAAYFFKQKIKPHHVILSLMAFTGMGFLLNLENFKINIGEILTLGAAVTAAFQIIFIGQTASKAKSPFRFNTYQTFWSCMIILPLLVIETRTKHLSLWPDTVSMRSLLSVIALALFVSVFAFYLQVRAQRVLSTTTSSMLCLLEGPFAFVFAAYFLGENLNFIQLIGAFIILLSCALSIYYEK